MKIQWYPGHMVKAKQQLQESLKVVDLVIEVLDARIPKSSRNPDLAAFYGDRPCLLVLNKADLAEVEATEAWINYYRQKGFKAVAVSSLTGLGVSKILPACREVARPRLEKLRLKGLRPRAVRAMVVGIPNVGKSSLINRLTGRAPARTGELPGVTRGKQWIRLRRDLELLDTPGVLWPKLTDAEIGFKLILVGTISELVYDEAEVATELVEFLQEHYPQVLSNRYRLGNLTSNAKKVLEQIGRKRGCLLPGGEVDYQKAGKILLRDFREGKLGRFTLDRIDK
ncbi:ribosome biogenesis GTPase YlqF [Calderihabitans maritimus]|uniref:Ribosome biogenesis GTPase A n=1 Tax=Calderihabitans maritimus TaxID=1246530 RepID=A0A1Z5HU24_9FIRM|nr:ribosome biogenesis GTPase YlqF [Calderihabitans maritimus]GAW92831.1 ribosome biogenesis GTP-binding protein YlqF [Calderihabitans maritimus]